MVFVMDWSPNPLRDGRYCRVTAVAYQRLHGDMGVIEPHRAHLKTQGTKGFTGDECRGYTWQHQAHWDRLGDTCAHRDVL